MLGGLITLSSWGIFKEELQMLPCTPSMVTPADRRLLFSILLLRSMGMLRSTPQVENNSSGIQKCS